MFSTTVVNKHHRRILPRSRLCTGQSKLLTNTIDGFRRVRDSAPANQSYARGTFYRFHRSNPNPKANPKTLSRLVERVCRWGPSTRCVAVCCARCSRTRRSDPQTRTRAPWYSPLTRSYWSNILLLTPSVSASRARS
eukprot:1054930-Pyramimonas_sp.AAC.1